MESLDHLSPEELEEIASHAAISRIKDWKRRAIVYAAMISLGTFGALGALAWWHSGLISRGETSIEARINKTEAERYKAKGRKYQNPYDFGPRENWRLFLGLNGRYETLVIVPCCSRFHLFLTCRSWWHVLFPSTHGPYGDGLTWTSIHDAKAL